MSRSRLPEWLRDKDPLQREMMKTRRMLRGLELNTVCQNARCPNIGECYSRDTATFMILGSSCTRNCAFCAVTHRDPKGVDLTEPNRIAQAVIRLDLKHVVITSVTRDDLPLGGARQFARVIEAVRSVQPEATVEILTPDFQLEEEAIAVILEAGPEVFNHNIETVPSLYPTVRPQADYQRSLDLLRAISSRSDDIIVKSGIMLGLGESREELREVWEDLLAAGCQILTMGQYLQPTHNNLEVEEYIHPDTFKSLKREAEEMGFARVVAGPHVRSSYLAEESSGELI